mgnify:CR=1
HIGASIGTVREVFVVPSTEYLANMVQGARQSFAIACSWSIAGHVTIFALVALQGVRAGARVGAAIKVCRMNDAIREQRRRGEEVQYSLHALNY